MQNFVKTVNSLFVDQMPENYTDYDDVWTHLLIKTRKKY